MKKFKNIYSKFLVGIGILSFLYSCEIQENFEYTPSPDNTKLNMDALSYINSNDSLSFMEEAIKLAGMESFYNSQKEYTFIVPNNQAFRAYFKANGYSKVADVPVPILKNMLKYHIVNGIVNFNNPELSASNRPKPYDTENGQIMYLSHTSTFVGIINEGTKSQWQIRTSNLVPDNGVIHISNFITFYSAPTGDTNTQNPNLILDTIYPKHDTFIRGGIDKEKNFGTETLMKVKNVTNNGDYDTKSLMLFDFKDFEKPGIVTDLRLQVSVSFTHAKSVDMNLFETPSTSWTETSAKFSNTQMPTTPRIAFLKTSKVSFFNFDITDYYKSKKPTGLVSLMLDNQMATDETNEFATKEHPTLLPPMLIATFASGLANLVLEHTLPLEVENGGVSVFTKSNLEVSGASPMDVIYTIDTAPSFGWILKGADVLKAGSKFSQLDLDLNNLLFIHDGKTVGSQSIMLTARDRAGAELENIELKINVK